LGLMHLLVQYDLIDHSFIAAHVQGFGELMQSQRISISSTE